MPPMTAPKMAVDEKPVRKNLATAAELTAAPPMTLDAYTSQKYGPCSQSAILYIQKTSRNRSCSERTSLLALGASGSAGPCDRRAATTTAAHSVESDKKSRLKSWSGVRAASPPRSASAAELAAGSAIAGPLTRLGRSALSAKLPSAQLGRLRPRRATGVAESAPTAASRASTTTPRMERMDGPAASLSPRRSPRGRGLERCRYRKGGRPGLSRELGMPAATAALHTLNARLVKAKHELHTSTLKVDAIRSECDRAQHKVEENDAAIASMEREEQRLKLAYVEGKLTYEKAHAEKYTLQQELKQLRAQRQVTRRAAASRLPGLLARPDRPWRAKARP
eukprot:scaffold2702_cov116-Isochrysis_galbana.AAC.5